MKIELRDVFRHSMRRLATTVNVVTCSHAGERFGVTATAVTSLCAEPASLLVCLNTGASITDRLLESGRFCVNILHSQHAHIAAIFGGGARGQARFEHGAWDINEDGIPFLRDAQANLFCDVDSASLYGTHRIVVGRLVGGAFADEVSPLLYQNGRYAAVAPLNS